MVAGSRQASGYWPSGYSLVELLFAVAIMATVSAIAIPQSLAAVDRARALSAARFLASRMAVARSQAVMRSTHVALRFEDHPSGITFRMFVDGNRNGVRTADISTGIDVPVEAPVSLNELYQGVTIALSEGAGLDPVKLGASNLLSFTPLGTSTSGSVFVRGRDGSQFAVRVLGATGRVRVLRFVVHSGTWTDTF
jgi:prepilin-type N-terminal cleavage/methylation domain-containing protein